MTGFTSGTQSIQGRTVNHDQKPNVCEGRRYPDGTLPYAAFDGAPVFYDPRPQYAVLDNPILESLREYERKYRVTDAAEYWMFALETHAAFGGFVEWDQGSHMFHSLVAASDDEREHAYRVLRKLIAVRHELAEAV